MIRKFITFFLISQLLIALFESCETSNDNNNSDNQEFENTEDERNNSNFDQLDEKMDDIMGEDQINDEKEVQEVKLVKAEGANQVKVDLKIGAGKLRMTGGSSELMLAGFIYTDAKWKPKISYILSGKTGKLLVQQPSSKDINFNNNDKYVWNLKFNNQIPIDFKVELGAGLSEIKLSGLNLNSFSMEMGVGKTEIDLRGEWKKSTSINLTGGIGHTKIFIPENVGVKLNVDKGIGSVDFSNLIQKNQNHYENKLAENAEIVLNINIKTGIGRIEIE